MRSGIGIFGLVAGAIVVALVARYGYASEGNVRESGKRLPRRLRWVNFVGALVSKNCFQAISDTHLLESKRLVILDGADR
jgi:hypothetical protein